MNSDGMLCRFLTVTGEVVGGRGGQDVGAKRER